MNYDNIMEMIFVILVLGLFLLFLIFSILKSLKKEEESKKSKSFIQIEKTKIINNKQLEEEKIKLEAEALKKIEMEKAKKILEIRNRLVEYELKPVSEWRTELKAIIVELLK